MIILNSKTKVFDNVILKEGKNQVEFALDCLVSDSNRAVNYGYDRLVIPTCFESRQRQFTKYTDTTTEKLIKEYLYWVERFGINTFYYADTTSIHAVKDIYHICENGWRMIALGSIQDKWNSIKYEAVLFAK